MNDAQVETKAEEATVAEETQEEEKPVKKKRAKTGGKGKRKRSPRKKKAPVYNIEEDPETGAMKLQEIYYLRLTTAQQKIEIRERDLQIAKSTAREFQANANAQLVKLQAMVKEIDTGLKEQRVLYLNEAREVEEATGLSLKDWLISDDRTLRPIESDPPEKQQE